MLFGGLRIFSFKIMYDFHFLAHSRCKVSALLFLKFFLQHKKKAKKAEKHNGWLTQFHAENMYSSLALHEQGKKNCLSFLYVSILTCRLPDKRIHQPKNAKKERRKNGTECGERKNPCEMAPSYDP